MSESSVPKGSGLVVAPAGVENTIRLEMAANTHMDAIAVLELICSVGMLSGISVAQVRLNVNFCAPTVLFWGSWRFPIYPMLNAGQLHFICCSRRTTLV